jgi:hypothetical protein
MVWRGWTAIHITSYDTSRLTQTEAEIERLRTVYGIPRLHVVVRRRSRGAS